MSVVRGTSQYVILVDAKDTVINDQDATNSSEKRMTPMSGTNENSSSSPCFSGTSQSDLRVVSSTALVRIKDQTGNYAPIQICLTAVCTFHQKTNRNRRSVSTTCHDGKGCYRMFICSCGCGCATIPGQHCRCATKNYDFYANEKLTRHGSVEDMGTCFFRIRTTMFQVPCRGACRE